MKRQTVRDGFTNWLRTEGLHADSSALRPSKKQKKKQRVIVEIEESVRKDNDEIISHEYSAQSGEDVSDSAVDAEGEDEDEDSGEQD